jgi:hypothetical protein
MISYVTGRPISIGSKVSAIRTSMSLRPGIDVGDGEGVGVSVGLDVAVAVGVALHLGGGFGLPGQAGSAPALSDN